MKRNIIIIFLFSIFLSSCKKEASDPSITTVNAYPLTATSGFASCKITNMGSYTVSDHGFVCYFAPNNSLDYVMQGSTVSLGSTIKTDTFSSLFTIPEAYQYSGYSWYVRAYITNTQGTLYANPVSFSPLVTSLTNIIPTSTAIGDTISLIGTNFDPNPNNDQVQFSYINNYTAKVISATKTTLRVIVPNLENNYYGSESFNIILTIGGQSWELYNVFTLALSVTSFSPPSSTFGGTVNIYCSNPYQPTGVLFGNTAVSYYAAGSYCITCTVPYSITKKSFPIYVMNGTTKMLVPGGLFTMSTMSISSVSPTNVLPGGSINIYGQNFNPTSSYDRIYLGSTLLTTNYTGSSTYLNATLPSSLANGNYKLSVSDGCDSITFPSIISVVNPTISGISPESGCWGTQVLIAGHNLDSCSWSVYLNNTYVSGTSIFADTVYCTVPASLSPGTYTVSMTYNLFTAQSPTNFTLLAPVLTKISPSIGLTNSLDTIYGNGFGYGTSVNAVSVTIGNLKASINAVYNMAICLTVPAGLASGQYNVIVTVNNYTIPTSLTYNVQ